MCTAMILYDKLRRSIFVNIVFKHFDRKPLYVIK